VRRTVGLLGAFVLLGSACGSGEQKPQAVTPPDVPAALTDQQAFTGITLPPEFDLASTQGFRTAYAGAGTDGARRDSWELLGDRVATLWRDDAGAEYVTAVELDGTPAWHRRIPELLEPAGERPLQPSLERILTPKGPDWLVVTNVGSARPGGPVDTRVLTLNADTGELGLDFTLPADRVGVETGAGHLSATVWDEQYEGYYTLLVDLETGEQERFDNPEVRTEDFVFIDQVTGFFRDKPIYRRACLQILAPPDPDGIDCPQALLYDGREYASETDFLPLPEALLTTEAGQRLVAENPKGLPVELPCPTGTTRGIPQSPSGRYVVVGNNLVDLQNNITICGADSLWWTAIDDGGRGWGRLDGHTTLRVTYDLASRSVTTTEMPGAEAPLAITQDRQGLFAAAGEGTDVLLLAPQ
jgi:hypothetical protein